jgi:hypothetical protein
VCTKARIFEDADLATLAGSVATQLDLAGSFCIQVMKRHEDYTWQITDINPRPGAGTRMTAAAGVDLTAAGMAEAFGEDPQPFLKPLEHTTHVVRTYEEWVL